MSKITSRPGKITGIGLVRTKDGIPRIQDMSTIPDGMKKMILGEVDRGLYTLEDIYQAQAKLEAEIEVNKL